MNVLFVLDGLWVGGTERSVAEMLPCLPDLGVRPTVACLRTRSEGVEEDVRAAGIEVVILSGTSLPVQVRSLRRLLAERRPALVHSALYRSNLVARLAAAGTGIPLLNSLVNDSYAPERFADPGIRPWRLRVVQGIDALTGRLLADHFHAVSRSVAEAASRRLAIPSDRITVVPRGRDPERLGEPSEERRRAARAVLGIEESAPVVVNVGRQEFQKGQEHLLRAAARLREDWPRLVVLIAGRAGAASTHLGKLAGELDLACTVRFLGHRDDVPELLAAADVFAFPSLFEGFPGAAVEAMAFTLPVVGSDIGPLREILGRGSGDFLVKSESPCALAVVLDRLLRDPEMATVAGRVNRERFLAELTIEKSVLLMVELYRRLADQANVDQSRRSGSESIR